MIEYKGYTIAEGQGMYGVKIYKALRNSHHSIASNQSLAWIVARIDQEVEKEGAAGKECQLADCYEPVIENGRHCQYHQRVKAGK